MANLESRQGRGQAIAHIDGQVKRVDERTYLVHSQTGQEWYDVLASEIGWLCSCPDHIYRAEKCKHIWAVEFSNALRNQVLQTQTVITPLDPQVCLFCSSPQVIRRGVRHNAYGDVQRFLCNSCGKRFVRNLGFERVKATPQAVTGALQLYFSGESLRNVQKFLNLQGVHVSHQTVYNWIRKYISLMDSYLDRITPNVSSTWRADEMYLKVKGNPKYLYALMDDQTRFWISQQVGNDKMYGEAVQTARTLFSQGEAAIGRKPRVLITDGLHAYGVACRKEWYSRYNSNRTYHVHKVTLSGKVNNNKMERMNGEVRDREKVIRGLKKPDTPILKGYQLYHNYFRPHEGLNGKTPAEAAGITISGQNRWITVIQNASHPTERNTGNQPTGR